MKVNTFEELSLDGLRDIYDAEQRILSALPEMAEAATAQELKSAFQEHERQTREQVSRLDQIFEMMGVDASGKECVAMRGLIAEGRQHIKEIEKGPLLDAALIGAAQRVEHYEMAAYGTARNFARQMGDQEAERLLQTTLDEEAKTDEKLTNIAVSVVNQKAAQQQSAQA
ncbi:MAG: ferritin-like domain-containing protein [Armatimonadaceae bacterium]